MFDSLFPKNDPVLIRSKYHIPNEIKLNIKITSDGWFLITSPDLPGLVTQARDAKELLEMVNDAILTYFDVPERESKSVFNKIAIEGCGTVENERPEKVLVTN